MRAVKEDNRTSCWQEVNGVKIERHCYNPAQIKTEAPKNWENINEAIEAAKKARTAQAANSAPKENKTPGAYIEVFEVHGVLPTCFLAAKATTQRITAQRMNTRSFSPAILTITATSK